MLAAACQGHRHSYFVADWKFSQWSWSLIQGITAKLALDRIRAVCAATSVVEN